MLRKPAVAGRFYPVQKDLLRNEVEKCLGQPQADISACGIIVPHAGYVYSGRVAGAVYSRIKIPSRAIVLCPNHTGFGSSLAIMSEGTWEIPSGKLQIDSALASKLIHQCHLLTDDFEAHRFEHALEVQLPFLHRLRQDIQFVPIVIGTSGYVVLEHLGKAIDTIRRQFSENILVIASSDMNHYESDTTTRAKDKRAIEKILALDPRGLYDVVRTESISMCGYGPAVAMMHGIQPLAARKAEMISYATSGEVNGNFQEVVGYAGIAIC